MEAALLGSLIPVGYFAIAGLAFFYSIGASQRYRDPSRYDVNHAAFAFMIAAGWALTLWFVVPWVLSQGRTRSGSELSRKQRRKIEFDRLQLKLAQDQADWLERVQAKNLTAG